MAKPYSLVAGTLVLLAGPALAELDGAATDLGTCAGYLAAITQWNMANSDPNIDTSETNAYDLAATEATIQATIRVNGGDEAAVRAHVEAEQARLFELYDSSIFDDSDEGYEKQDAFLVISDACEAIVQDLPEVMAIE